MSNVLCYSVWANYYLTCGITCLNYFKHIQYCTTCYHYMDPLVVEFNFYNILVDVPCDALVRY